MFKEYGGFEVMQALNLPIILHDDKLTLRAQKKTVTGAVNVRDEFYKSLERVEIVSFWNPETGEHVTLDKYDPDKHEEWRACWKRGAVLAENVYIFTQCNQVDLVLANLWEDFRRRYRIALEAALAAMLNGVIPYRPKAGKYGRNALEAVRNRLKRNFVISEYETDFLLNPGLTEILESEAKLLQGVEITRNTIFLKHTEEVTVKFYKPCEREKINAEGLTNWGKSGKLEIALRRDFFKRAGIRVEDLGEQPEIFELIRERITREVKGMINTLSKPARAAIARELGLETYTAEGITQRMLNVENTMTYVLRKIKEMEKHMRKIDERVEALEKKTGTKKQEQDPWNEGVPF